MSEYLYPVRRNRRDFLAAAGAMAATVGLGGLSSAREAEEKFKEINAAYSTLRASEHLPVE